VEIMMIMKKITRQINICYSRDFLSFFFFGNLSLVHVP
jgi:hypothetical protein